MNKTECDAGDVRTAPKKAVVMKRLADMGPALRKRGMMSLALYGSVVRDEATADSDIDLLIDTPPGKGLCLVKLLQMENELSDDLGYKVDLGLRDGIKLFCRDKVLAEAETIF